VTAAQKPLLSLAFQWDINYIVVPLLALWLWTMCLSVVAQTILQAMQERTRITSDVYLHYRID
jgi:ferric iron reductase protein FhuF